MNNNNPYIQYIEAHPELQKKIQSNLDRTLLSKQ